MASLPMETVPAGPENGPSPGRRRRPRRRRALAAGATVLVAAVGTGLVLIHPFAGGAEDDAAGKRAATALGVVTRGRVSARIQVNGTLGYGGGDKVVNQARGTYSALPRAGRVVHQGQVLYEVSGRPVALLAGSAAPLYRTLSNGTSGADVRQLNADLIELGYASGTSLSARSSYFGAATAYALKRFQAHLGTKETGRLAPGQAVFLPRGTVRITKVNALFGAPAAPGTTVLETSSTVRQVSVSLDASGQSQVKAGDKVSITLPDGRTTPGTVSSVSTVARKGSDGSATIAVRITPSNRAATGRLDQAPVQVSIVTESADNVLAVPVTALLALASGGYAVEVVQPGGGRRLVSVTTGLSDTMAGTVQVSGAGLAEGQRVVVPAS